MYRVLLVEDDSALRFLYSRMTTWTDCGFQIVKEAKNGKEAIEILQSQSFDLIFTDIRMPFIDGIELVRKLEPMGITTTVVFCSSYDEFEYARQGLIYGVFDYILKPIDTRRLREVLIRVKEHIKLHSSQEVLPAIEQVLHHFDLTPNSSKLVYQVSVYLSKHYGEIITMEDVSDELGFSKDYFGKLFKQQFGTSFHEFISRVKISYAIELLQCGNYLIYEISEMLGYSSTDYFTKVFKEITGYTPSEFKNNLKINID